MNASASLGERKRRVLVVEDEILIAMLMEGLLQQAGYVVVGPCASLAEALRAARAEGLDAALLDVNLGGERVDPVADLLRLRQVPFIFVTGYDAQELPSWNSELRIAKPFRPTALVRAVAALLGSAPTQRGP